MVQDGPIRKTLSIAAIGVAALVCIQIGVVQVRRNDRAVSLEGELASLRSSRASEVERLRKQLALTERAAARLRNELASAEAASDELQIALADADSARSELSNELGAVSQAIGEERPALDVQLAPFGPAGVLAATVTNRSVHPIDVRESQGWFWVDGAMLPLSGSLAPMRVDPGGDGDVFEWDAAAHSLELVPGSKQPVRGAVCFVYERTLENETTSWVEERWFEYRANRGQTATLRRDSWKLAAGESGCGLEGISPPW